MKINCQNWILMIFGLLFLLFNQGVTKIANTPVDLNATAETRALLFNLIQLSGKGIMFGHQDDLAYGIYWWATPGKSDIKSVCGDYPAVYGWDIGKIELGSTLNLDGVNFNNLRGWILEAYSRGGINTISWHSTNPVSGGNAWDTTPAVRQILPGGSHHELFKARLDKVADFLSTLKMRNGEFVPIIFRPYHEHTGNWFWWGAGNCTREEYVQLWRFTVEYLRDVKGLHHLLYAYSPNNFTQIEEYLDRYPGDEYVDILGLDDYTKFSGGDTNYGLRMLRSIVDLAEKKGKVAALTELGLNLNDNNCWTEFFTPVKNDPAARKISYFLVWRNANPTHFFGPYPGHPSVPDFVNFYNDDFSIFERDLPDMYEISEIDSIAPIFLSFPDSDFVSYKSEVSIELDTDKPAFLRYDFSDLPFDEMGYRFVHGEGTTHHRLDFSANHGEHYTLFVRARDFYGNESAQAAIIPFSVDTTKEEIKWYDPRYDRTNWKQGQAPLGFGRADIATETARTTTIYLCKEFNFADPAEIEYSAIILKYDNGAAIYINGNEMRRINLPEGTLYEETFALGEDMGIKSIILNDADKNLLHQGNNLIAVEIHRSERDSSDLFFDLKLITDSTIIDLGSEWQYWDEGEPASQVVPKTNVKKNRNAKIGDFKLYPAFPNPFNQAVHIRFELQRSRFVELTVFDINGRVVKRLVSQRLLAGKHDLIWDGTNDAHEILASGVYLIKIKSENQVETVKSIFLK